MRMSTPFARLTFMLCLVLAFAPVAAFGGSKDLHHNIKVSQALPPLSISDNTVRTSAVVDTQDYGSLEFVISIGAVADVDATFTTEVLECDASNCSDNVAVDNAFLFGTEAAASFRYDSDNSVKTIGYKGGKRYVQFTITPALNTGAAVYGAVAVQGNPHIGPQ